MKKQMHLAAQYLAAAGISFLDKKDDDSHTNLGFNVERGCLETHFLSENKDQLLLCYEDFLLLWKSDSAEQSFPLDGATHQDVLVWIKEMAKNALNKEYSYKLHYELPYSINATYTFKLDDFSALKQLMHLRILIQLSLEEINRAYGFDSSIRIWPHHFDSGIYSVIPGTEKSVGLGLAIPDSVCGEHYLYASGYDAKGQMTTSDFKKLTKGYWSKEGYIGGVLPAKDLLKSEAVHFFKEAVEQFKTR